MEDAHGDAGSFDGPEHGVRGAPGSAHHGRYKDVVGAAVVVGSLESPILECV